MKNIINFDLTIQLNLEIIKAKESFLGSVKLFESKLSKCQLKIK